ncbi:Xaa-Pro aminopeptidase [Thiomicrorhabdus sp. ZW0627]|uniref:Xaa-Pro aminopeptidase n=1 Tax=Thiomicrorhabdus sp. ZW0627 TaxID=3039774 RepID=UPI002436C7C6|nr:Xaa-Pro aminopeptidase [Thiomicrorhabdus sp. ZW0627]MDG6773229.1 Xaa-Pro aminopeptidase [Thiomicrorhabdus sp. ZW0627]
MLQNDSKQTGSAQKNGCQPANHMIDMAQEHRHALFAKLPENSAVLVSSGHEQIRNRDVEFPFRAESDFFYLTGFSEPDSVLLLLKTSRNQSVLFVRPRDPEQETWQGRRLGVEMAPAILKIDQAWSIEEMDEHVAEYLENIENLYFSFGQMATWMEPVEQWLSTLKSKVRRGVSAPTQLCDLDTITHEMRLFKSDAEVALMREAARISVEGHLAAMRSVAAGKYEFQVQADLEATFMQHGSQKVAFNSIVASGDNACILHYTENSDQMGRHQLVLVDAGAEFRGYAGDITTTFPVSGRFSEEQKSLYELVYQAQQTAIDCIKPGVCYSEPHQKVIEILTTGLVELGLLNGDVQALIKEEAYRAFFMHGTGHWLGMDVHDVGSYKINGDWREFEPGMVVTVEPGLYVDPGLDDVEERWKGIGIRIEDDILVTDSGSEVLTKGLPRTVEAIEQWMSENNPNV